MANAVFFSQQNIYLSLVVLTGNLKHKDLMGQVISSQAYVEDQNDNVDDDLAEAVDEDQHVSVASDEQETE